MHVELDNWNRSLPWAVSSTRWVQLGSVALALATGFLIPLADAAWEFALLGFVVGATFTAYFWARTSRGWLILLDNQVKVNAVQCKHTSIWKGIAEKLREERHSNE